MITARANISTIMPSLPRGLPGWGAKGPRYVSKRLNASAAPRNAFLSLVGSSSALLRPHCRQYGNFASRLLCKMSADVEGLTSYQPAEVDIVFSRET